MQEVDAQQGLHCKGLLAPASALGSVVLYQQDQFCPRNHQFHGIEEFALAGALDCIVIDPASIKLNQAA
jgi:hypothetical protein